MREGRELKHVFKSLFTVRFLECPYFGLVNPLSPRSHEHVNSPYNIQTLSNRWVMRILKLIR